MKYLMEVETCKNCGTGGTKADSALLINITDTNHFRDSVEGMEIHNLLNYIFDKSIWFCSRLCCLDYLIDKENKNV